MAGVGEREGMGKGGGVATTDDSRKLTRELLGKVHARLHLA